MDPAAAKSTTSTLLTPPASLNRNGSEKRKAKRKKRSAANSTNASGTSTPQLVFDLGDDPQALGESMAVSNLSTQPSTSGVATATNDAEASNTSFADEDDFIPFSFASSDDERDGEVRVTNGKGKEKEKPPGDSSLKGKERVGDEDPFGDRDGERKLSRRERRDRDRDRKRPRSPSPRSRREWDRGKRSRPSGGDRYDRYDYGPTNKAPWVRGLDLDDCKNVAEMMHREVKAFVSWISPSHEEDEIRGLIVKQISAVVKSKFPDANVLPFGSYETKLYLPLGDIDLVIMSESMAYSDKVSVLHALANTLKRAGITSRVSIIAKARVPIVKFVTTHGRFNVDISINQENGLVAGNIINGFLRELHNPDSKPKTSLALRSLVLITKAFLAQRSMNEVYTGGLGSYSIVCLAVSFLQMHPKIRRGEIDPDENLGVLVMEFFELYGCCFNYDEVGISVRAGGTYFSKRQRGWYDFSKRAVLSIEDHADPSNDISKGSFGFHKVRTALAGAHSILTSTAYLHAGMINARKNGQSVNLRGRYEAEDLSILSTVMGITQETLNHRRLVQELYDQRTLHKILNIQPVPVLGPPGDPSTKRPTKGNPSSKSKPTELRIQGAANARLDEAEDSDDGYRDAQLRLDYGDEDDERGRYAIGQPPRKRQRTGKQDMGHHTIFVTDDDDEDEHDHPRDADSEEERGVEDESRYRHRRDPAKEKEKYERHDRRRSYWLSKGIGPGLGNDSFEQYSGSD